VAENFGPEIDVVGSFFYIFTGPDGSSMGMFGPIYEMTLGRGLKSPAYINKKEADEAYFNSQDKYPVSEELGGIPKGMPRDPSSFTALGRDAIRTVTEGLGLRTFAASSILGVLTGESNLDAYTPEYESASKLDSLNSNKYAPRALVIIRKYRPNQFLISLTSIIQVLVICYFTFFSSIVSIVFFTNLFYC